MNRKLGFLGQYGYDIFGNNKLFTPLVKWGKLEEDVEEIKDAAKTYEDAFNDILSTCKTRKTSSRSAFLINFKRLGILFFSKFTVRLKE